MYVELNKKDLISIVIRFVPYNYFMESLNKYGFYNVHYWEWNLDELRKCTEEELFNIYKICTDSWKKANN